MRQAFYFTFLFTLLLAACGQSSEPGSFRDKIDQAKEKVADSDFSVSTYAFDNSKHWSALTQIVQKQKSGIKSTTISSTFTSDGNLIKEVVNNLNQKVTFQGQAITTDSPDTISLGYLVSDENNNNTLFKVSCNKNGEFVIERIDSTESHKWKEITSKIFNKN
jgi:hypothetical protein